VTAILTAKEQRSWWAKRVGFNLPLALTCSIR